MKIITTPAGNSILRTERPDYSPGREMVWYQIGPHDPKGPCPEFLMPLDWKPADVDALISERQAADAEQAKIAAIDAAIDAEVAKRKASVDYTKDATDALSKIFTALTAEVPK